MRYKTFLVHNTSSSLQRTFLSAAQRDNYLSPSTVPRGGAAILLKTTFRL